MDRAERVLKMMNLALALDIKGYLRKEKNNLNFPFY